jgi:HSP20 family protein
MIWVMHVNLSWEKGGLHMPGLIIWKDREIDKMKKDINRLMSRLRSDFCTPFLTRTAGRIRYVELSETDDNLVVKAEVLDMNPDNLDVSVAENVLSIKGEVEQEKVREDLNYNAVETVHSSFSRIVQLPCRVDIDKVEATYKHGTLQVVLPKCKSETARKVKIKVK